MLNKVRRFFDRMIGGYEQILPSNDIMRAHIMEWDSIYKNKPKWLGPDDPTLCLGSSVATELARLVTLEMVSEIDDNEELNELYQKEVMKDIRTHMEYAIALGGMAMKPYINRRGELKVEFISALDFIPLNEELTSACFLDKRIVDNRTLVRVETHVYDEHGVYTVTNEVFESYDSLTGFRQPLSVLDEWADLEEEITITGLDGPLFVYMGIPNANTIDKRSPLGVSMYSKAIDLIEQADKQWGRILWEYEATELAIDVDLTMLSGPNVDKLPQGKDRIFRQLDTGEDGFYEVFNPDIRDTSLFNGLNKILQRVEFNCGLAYGTLSDVQITDKTATEIKFSKQRSFSTIKDIQTSLEEALKDLIDILLKFNQLYHIINIETIKDVSVSFEFDDSIVEDAETEQKILLQEVAAGIISKEEYLMRRYNVSLDQALDMMPKEMWEEDVDANTPIFTRNIRKLDSSNKKTRESDD